MWKTAIFAFLAILLVGAGQPQGNTQTEHRESAQEAAQTVPTAIRETRRDEDPVCQDRYDERSSDLCAQWKAADAARDAADYTFLAVLLSFMGTALIALTFRETYATGRRELRAYIGLMDYSLTPIEFENAATGKLSIGLKNYGQTPAIAVTSVIAFGFVEWKGNMRKPDEWSFVGERNPIDVAPSADFGRTVSFRSEGFEHFIELPNGDSAICVDICCSYLDIFGVRHQQTTTLWSRGLTYRAGNLIVMRQDREVSRRWWQFWRKHAEPQKKDGS